MEEKPLENKKSVERKSPVKKVMFVSLILVIAGLIIAGFVLLKKLNILLPDSLIDKTGVQLSSPEKITEYVNSLPVEDKPSVSVKMEAKMPSDNNSLLFFMDGTTFGENGVGIGCGTPVFSEDKKGVEFTFYITAKKLIEKLGREEAQIQAERLFRLCLNRVVLLQTEDLKEAAEISGQYLESIDKGKLLNLE